MAVYEHFNKYNAAPPDTEKIAVFNEVGKRIGHIPLGTLTPPDASERLYSFGVLSDPHIGSDTGAAITAFNRAMKFFAENADIKFVCVAGDLVESGDTEEHWEAYADVLENNHFRLPNDKKEGKRVYAIVGNHDRIYNYAENSYETAEFVKNYTGYGYDPNATGERDDGVCYSFEYDGDVFIMLGVYSPATLSDTGTSCQAMLNVEDADRAKARFETNRNKRCFVFQHYMPPILSDHKNILTSTHYNHYKNTIVFHGHTHHEFEMQTASDPDTIYTQKDGYRSVHIPSCNDRSAGDNGRVIVHQGYIVDVYRDKIHLIGIDFKTDTIKYAPLGIYAIDTTIVNVEAKTET